jgi:hypothetical protein
VTLCVGITGHLLLNLCRLTTLSLQAVAVAAVLRALVHQAQAAGLVDICITLHSV